MGSVIVLYRILPDSPDNFEAVKEALEGLKPDRLDDDPIAFSLKAIKFIKMIPDAPGAEEELEKTVMAIEHVETVETISVTRSL